MSKRASTGADGTAAVERAFAVLRAVAASNESLGVSAVARACALPKSTVARLIATLQTLEMLERLPGAARYRLGPGLDRLVHAAGTGLGLRELARPFVRDLVEAVGEDAGLAVADGDRVLFVDQVLCRNPVQVPDWSGHRLPYHTTAAGLVLLAAMNPSTAAPIVAGPLSAWAPATVTDPAKLAQRLQQARRSGLAWVHGEWADGVSGVAVPIIGSTGRTLAALNVYGPTYRFPGKQGAVKIEQLLIEASRRIGALL